MTDAAAAERLADLHAATADYDRCIEQEHAVVTRCVDEIPSNNRGSIEKDCAEICQFEVPEF